MLNTIRADEIRKEILKIEKDQEEAGQCIRKLQREEEDANEELRDYLSRISSEFEACHGDAKLTTLMEGKYNLLLKMERESEEFLDDLHEEQKTVKNICEADIEKLKQELQRLEVIAIE